MKISFLFAWYDIWIGFFWDKKKGWLYILPIPCIGVILKFKTFRAWMEEVKQVFYKNAPLEYFPAREWEEDHFKIVYYWRGFTPEETWNEYTRHIE